MPYLFQRDRFFFVVLILAALGLSCGMHVRSSSLTRDRTWAPCIRSVESYPLDHQGSPQDRFFLTQFTSLIRDILAARLINLHWIQCVGSKSNLWIHLELYGAWLVL